MRRQQLALQSKLHEKDAEIVRLTNQVVNKTLATVTESELESRIRALTENLIQKQMIIENLQTERHSLSLQLERVSVSVEKFYFFAQLLLQITFFPSENAQRSRNCRRPSLFHFHQYRRVRGDDDIQSSDIFEGESF